MLSKFQIETIAMILYLLAIAIPVVYFFMEAGVFFLFILLIPAFFISAFLFFGLDWGLKTLWTRHDWLGIVPVVILFALPFVAKQIFQQDYIMAGSGIATGMLIWAILVVALQLGLGLYREEIAKAKHNNR